jgi:hypothetical protein
MHYAAELGYIKLQILIQYLILANLLNIAAGSSVVIDL